jgi:hypothetical protein
VVYDATCWSARRERVKTVIGSASHDQAPDHSMDEKEPTAAALGGLLPEELGIWVRRRRVGSCP